MATQPTGSHNGNGTFALRDGVVLQMVNAALAAPSQRHGLVIEEINRGNASQIFTEQLNSTIAAETRLGKAFPIGHSAGVGERFADRAVQPPPSSGGLTFPWQAAGG